MAYRRRAVTTAAVALVSTGLITGCSAKTYDRAPEAGDVYGVPIVQIKLEGGRLDGHYLDCNQYAVYGDALAVDCDWDHPYDKNNPNKTLVGTFKVFEKHLVDDRVMECIAMGVYGSSSVDDCDWNNARRLVEAPR